MEENLARTRETRWTVIKSMIDDMFKEVHANWWTAVRPAINNFSEFKKLFKDKYWSQATQHVVRNNISNGRFDPYLGPVSYTHLDVYKRQAQELSIEDDSPGVIYRRRRHQDLQQQVTDEYKHYFIIELTILV